MKTILLKLKENKEIKVTEDTRFILDLSALDRPDKYKLELVFEKENISAEIIGVYKLGINRKLNLETIVNHKVPNTSCVTYIKGVLFDGAESSYVGKILISKKAQRTSSFLHDDVLVLGDKTKNYSEPILEIKADDVKASHGSTTGRVSEEQVYYLTSRGLSRSEAEEHIVEGFFESLLSKIEDLNIREKILLSVKS